MWAAVSKPIASVQHLVVANCRVQSLAVNSSGFYLHGHAGGWNVLTCDVHVVNAQYQFNDGVFTLLSASTAEVRDRRSSHCSSLSKLGQTDYESRAQDYYGKSSGHHVR